MDQNQQSRRGHYNRGRRGPDRRGPDRRIPPPQAAQQSARDNVDVEHIMRDIRARIAQRHGIDLSNQQIQELAARRLEAILDPRSIKPGLLDELRRSAGAPPRPEPTDAAELAYTFEDSTLYESHRAFMRFMRRLLNPILKLFFNPNPLIQALNIQARWNADATKRESQRERRQTEWNALHYELLHRMVTEVSRVTLELQSLSTQVESLSAKVDFNDRRVRNMEGSLHQARPAPPARSSEPVSAPAASGASLSAATTTSDTPTVEAPAEGQTSDSSRRRRRRRRGRRGSGAPGEGVASSQSAQPGTASETGSATAESSGDDGPDDEASPDEPQVSVAPAASTEPVALAEIPAPAEHYATEPAPTNVTPPAPEERDPEA